MILRMVDMYEEGKVEVNKANIKEFVIKNNIIQIENMTKLEYNMNEHRSVFLKGVIIWRFTKKIFV